VVASALAVRLIKLASRVLRAMRSVVFKIK